MRRRLLALLAVAAVVGACSGSDDGGQPAPEAAGEEQVPIREEEVPPELAEFLARARGALTTSFTAEYDVLRRLEGTTSTVTVRQEPPAFTVSVGPLVVVGGTEPATCRVDARACVEGVREELLSPYGLFSGFFSTGPARALAAAARRDDAGAPTFTTATAAGVELRCAAVPVQEAVTATACLTPEGVVGLVDNPSVTYRLTRYEVGPPAEPVARPFPLRDDAGFLLEQP